MTRTKYVQRVDSEWITTARFHKIACCNCGLVHLCEFRVVAGRIKFRAWRQRRKRRV